MREECIFDDDGNIFQDYLEGSSWEDDSIGGNSFSDETPAPKEPIARVQAVSEEPDAAIVIQSINQVPLNILRFLCQQMHVKT